MSARSVTAPNDSGAAGCSPQSNSGLSGDGKPLLGICVGMQLLADWSDELGVQQGLGWVGGSVQRLSPAGDVRVPHVGWNTVHFVEPFERFALGDEADFYFDHSYAYRAPRDGKAVATCTHGETFCAVIRRGALVAAQFHPEKSQTSGLRFLRGFLAFQPDRRPC